MNLGRKTLLVLAGASCVTVALSYVVLKTTVYPTFVELEKKWAVRNTNTVKAAIDAQLDNITAFNIEYSQWDDTYDFLSGSKPEFVAKYVNQDLLDDLDLDAFVLLDTQGQAALSFVRDADGTGSFQSSLPYPELDRVIDTLAVRDNATSQAVGVLGASGGPLLLVSRAVMHSDNSGPPAGSVVMARRLTESRASKLQKQLNISFKAIPIEVFAARADSRRLLAMLGAEASGLATVEATDNVLTYQLVADIAGDPSFVLEVATAREISGAGTSALNIALLFLAMTSLLYLLVSNQSLKIMIVDPVARLARHFGKLQESGDLSARLESGRSDELGLLTRQSNMLVAQLETSQNELIESRDAALQASKAKSEFLATMSHEIRTPINGVLGMTELLLNSKGLSDQQRRYATTVQQSGNSLLRVINDILDISKIEAGKVELEIAAFNLRDAIEGCLELLAESAHRKGLELIGAISLDTHTFVRGDSVRLSQIMTNLIANAVKFTEQGEIVVSVTEQRKEGAASSYRFEVKDTGVGISLANKRKLFEPFTQEDGSTTRRFGGTGLGLSICKSLAELMGGEIGVDSVPGQGSTFWFTAQLTRDEETSQSLQPDLLAGKSVLIVDDNETNREILRNQLEGWQMRVQESRSGSDALARISENLRSGGVFDIVLLDMQMPEMDGLCLAQAIRQEAYYNKVPLAMLSSVSGADVGAERNTTVDAWLAKPVRQARLHDTLVSLLVRSAGDTASQVAEQPATVANPVASKGGLKILLADDNYVNQSVVVGMLGSMGHQTTVCNDGQEAVAAFRSDEFDLVLMDCQMPELDGYDATRAIRRWEADQNKPATRIVALTANALDGVRERCLAAGMDDYLSKPFTMAQLKAVVAANAPDGSARPDNKVCAISPMQLSDSTTGKAPAASGRILVVEDDMVSQKVTQAVLQSIGYESAIASNGDDALRAMLHERFDLILMDCHMPVRDGYSTSEEIRRREENSATAHRVPIVALTADFLQSNRRKCLDCGMDDYLTKPFTQEHLRIVLARWLPDSKSKIAARPIAVDRDGFSDLGETTTLASINREMLEELCDLDPSNGSVMVREIIVSYCATSTKLMLQMRAAVAAGDSEGIALIAHSLKGCSGQVGAVLLASLCEHLITSVKLNDLSDTQTLCERAAIEHAAVIAGLDKELQRIAA